LCADVGAERVVIEVVIPAFNAGRFLRQALHSVAAQSLLPGRVTVVDDHSTDDTAAVAASCAGELAGRLAIRCIANAGPRGPSAARNSAMRDSAADWIALLDADDVAAPGHHAALHRLALAAPDAAVVFGDSTVFRGGTTLAASYFATGGLDRHPASEVSPGCWTLGERMFPALLKHGIFATSACMIRRAAGMEAGLFDEGMMQCEDTDFFLRLAMRHRFVFTREVIAHKRVHDANLSDARNKVAFERGTVRSLSKIAAMPDVPAGHRPELERALAAAIDSYLYHASRTGVRYYSDAARLAWRARFGHKAASPRHLARLVWKGSD
jgi:glycosyltransferase involved in cell wall biosynthesis